MQDQDLASDEPDTGELQTESATSRTEPSPAAGPTPPRRSYREMTREEVREILRQEMTANLRRAAEQHRK